MNIEMCKCEQTAVTIMHGLEGYYIASVCKDCMTIEKLSSTFRTAEECQALIDAETAPEPEGIRIIGR
jgi:hypothetical protein